jgi:hypothetical protein
MRRGRVFTGLWPVGLSFLASIDLTVRLIEEYPRIWSEKSSYGKDLTPKRMAWMLAKSYGIHSTQPVRGGPRGYSHSKFTLPWRRMGVTPAEGTDAPDASDASDAKSGLDVLTRHPRNRGHR